MPMTTTEDRRKVLEKRLAELEARLQGIETEIDSHQSKDWEDLATERETDEVLETLGTSGQVEISMIRAALDRIDAGEYGYCARCGEVIQPERLDVVPYTPLCRTCAGATARS
ncbi:TraR/DksA family transcriptional regulator [Psychromarinibacter halotolerans]|uniref:TraR/DksA family transcriptional regulator n=1 Tax=Psychromarinibacter halotolerans TaxID=1775175 RepID=A0ABV7GR60_9RHOB